MDDLYLRIRIDGAVAKKVTEMAHALDLELPAVIKQYLAQSAQFGSFALERPKPSPQDAGNTRTFFAYEDAQWDPLKTVLEGELALALLNQRLASCTVDIEALLDANAPDRKKIEKLRRQRNDVRTLLMGLDPSDRAAVGLVLDRFDPQRPSRSDASNDESAESTKAVRRD